MAQPDQSPGLKGMEEKLSIAFSTGEKSMGEAGVINPSVDVTGERYR